MQYQQYMEIKLSENDHKELWKLRYGGFSWQTTDSKASNFQRDSGKKALKKYLLWQNLCTSEGQIIIVYIVSAIL